MRHTVVAAIALLLMSPHAFAQPKIATSPFGRWEKAIAAFEAADARQAPAKGGVLFVGSSSIRMWKLDESFPNLAAINRGFGGSQTADSLHFADRIILPYAPRTIVVYAGDNDIAAGKSPEQVATDFEKLVARIHEALPKTTILYIAIKPSIKRWGMYEQMNEANRQIAALAKPIDRVTFIDIATPMIGDDGQPRVELFLKDGLHLNAKGYELWTSLVSPHLR